MKKKVLRHCVILGILGTCLAGIGTGIKVDAATYYGNGLYCNKEKCWVDWNQAKGEIGKIIVNGWVNHGPWAPRR